MKPGKSIEFFAGEVDDPFFFDLPAFNGFLDTLRSGAPSTAPFSRARDTFAGYNVLAMAVRIPTEWLVGSNGSKLGINFLTQRPATRLLTRSGATYTGAYRTIDRMGNPGVNFLFIPYDLRSAYNAATPHDDVALKFRAPIEETLRNFGISTDPAGASYSLLTNIFIAKGDLLQLDTAVPNDGTSSAASFPNGRRVRDDTVDILMTLLNNGVTLGDGVSTGGSPSGSFPFLGLPNQPLFTTPSDPEDRTRN